VLDCRVRHATRAVLFDLDGTLLDSFALILDSYAHTLARFGLPVPTRDALIADIGRPLTVILGRAARDAEHLEEMVTVYREYNLAHHDQRVAAFPGVVDLVRELKRRGLGTGVVTSKIHHNAELGIRVLGLVDAVDVIVGADDVAEPKPGPEPVLTAARRLGVRPDQAIMVGDSAHDIASGRAAGALTAAALWGVENPAALRASTPDHWLHHPQDLLPLLHP